MFDVQISYTSSNEASVPEGIKDRKNCHLLLLYQRLAVAAKDFSIPKSVESPGWILQYSGQLLYLFLSWMIVAQVQLPQIRRVGAQS